MEKSWICEACYASTQKINTISADNCKISCNFVTQETLIKHIKQHHLSRRIEHGRMIFVCTYGSSGICGKVSDAIAGLSPLPNASIAVSVFDSEYYYERHLVKRHLLNMDQAHLTSHSRDDFFPQKNPRDWTIYDSVVNMAAILNDPQDRQTDIFSRYFGDSFERAPHAPCYLPEVNEINFYPYLGVLSKRCPPPLLHPSKPSTCNNSPSFQGVNRIPSIFSSPEFSLVNPNTFHRVIPLYPRGSLENGDAHQLFNHQRRAPLTDSWMANYETPAPWEKIPQPTAFSQQNEQLSQYLDGVELDIIKHVSEQSSAFFEAVRGHDEVRDQISQTTAQVVAVRVKLQEIDSIYCQSAARLARLNRRKTHYHKALTKLKMIASVHSAQPTIQSLLKCNDFCSALDLVSSTQEILSSPDLSYSSTISGNDGSRFFCLRHLGAQLDEISKFVHTMVVSEFESALRAYLQLTSTSDSLLYEASELIPCVLGLLRIKHDDFVVTLQVEVLQAAKSIFNKAYSDFDFVTNSASTEDHTNPFDPTYDPKFADLSKTSINEKLRYCSFSAWMRLLETVCHSLKHYLLRVHAAIQVIVDTVKRSLHDNPIEGDEEEHECREDLVHKTRRVYWEAADWCQKQLAKMVTLRFRNINTSNFYQPLSSVTQNGGGDGSAAEQSTTSTDSTNNPIAVQHSIVSPNTERLTSNSFVHFASMLEQFHFVILEAWSFYRCPTTVSLPSAQSMLLRNLIASQATDLIHRFHADRSSKLDNALKQESWRATPVPATVQSMISQFLKQGNLPMTIEELENDAEHAWSTEKETLVLEGGETFVVVSSVLLLLPVMFDYLKLAEQLSPWPAFTRDTQLRLAKLVTIFNSRSCELVLGAGARELSVLTTISARNLALVARSIQVLLVVLPHMRAFLKRLITETQDAQTRTNGFTSNSSRSSDARRLGDPFVAVDQALRNHLAQLLEKLTGLLASRIASRLSLWRVRPPTPSTEIRAVCQAMTKLTDTTSDVLARETLTNLLLRVHVEFKAGLRQRLSELSIFPDGGPQQGLVDSELAFYVTNLRALTPSLAHFSDDCDEIWPSPP